MAFRRFSAVEIFGIPLDNPTGKPRLEDGLELQKNALGLVTAYSLEALDVPAESTDITPYYWQNPTWRYYVSLVEPEGSVIVEMLPRHADSELFSSQEDFRGLGDNQPGTPIRRLEIPTDGEIFALVGGGSPRFPGKLCLHELITQVD